MEIKMRRFWGITLVAGLTALTACTKYVEQTNAVIDTHLEQIEENLRESKVPDIPVVVDTVRTKNDIWLGDQSIKIMEGDPLPAWTEKEDAITLVIGKEADLPTVVQDLTDLTGLDIRLDDLKSGEGVPTETAQINYSGKLSGLLNYLSNRYGVWWRYKKGVLTFFKKETRVFTVYALPTETTMNASLQGATMGGQGGGGGGGDTSSSLSTSATLALWDSIEAGINQVLAGEGEVSFSRPTGSVTVTASPFVMRRVADYIANWNEKLSRQVAISVQILQVKLSNEDNYGLDLKAVFNSNKVGVSFASPYATSSTTGVLSMALVDQNSRWKDSKSIIEAFSTQGKTSLLTSASVTTLNNRVAPVQVATSENYVKETNVTTTGSGSDATTEVDMETDTLNYGFTMEVLPRILDHGRLILLFTLNLTDLLALETFSSSGESGSGSSSSEESSSSGETEKTVVQLPKIQVRGFIQEIAMRSGSTLVLTGFENTSDMSQTSGVGQPTISVLGGQAYDSHDRNVLVILLTPEILESPLSSESRMREF